MVAAFLDCFSLKKKTKQNTDVGQNWFQTQTAHGAYAFWEISTVFWLCLIISNYVLQHKLNISISIVCTCSWAGH